MCGIAAVVSKDGSNSAIRTAHAIKALHHRGPDRSRVWTSQASNVSLGHARLSIVDLAGGMQPLSNEAATITAVVNGEFYEYDRTRLDLEAKGHRFATNSDSEILIHLYEEQGICCLQQLQGEFAFILFDERTRTTFAGRDRLGVKPLYYFETSHEVVIASEVKALARAGVNLAWDERGFLEQLLLQASLSGRTLYRGVCDVPAGCYVSFGSGGAAKVHRYWDQCYPLDSETKTVCSDDSIATDLLERLSQAVHCRMQSDWPAACYLSGGIDSNSVLALMCHNSDRKIDSFCISFDDPAFDEFDLAAESAAMLGSKLTKVAATSDSLAADLRQTVWHCEQLIHNANAVAKFGLSRAVSESGYRVVLSGDGSDELFAGYPHFLADDLRYNPDTDLNELRRQLGLNAADFHALLYPPGQSHSPALLESLGYSPMWIESRQYILQQISNLLPNIAGKCELDKWVLRSLDVREQLHARSVLNQSLYIQSRICLPAVTLSTLGDRVEMAHSVEGRLPFLDHRVVDFARSLPASQKIRGLAGKFVLRKAMRALIPPEVCGRRKQPIAAPPALWDADSALGDMLQDTLRSRSLDSVPYVDRKATINLLDQMASGDSGLKQVLEPPLMAIASACILSELFSLS